MDEEQSDNCFAQVVGTGGYPHCSMNEKCLDVLTRKGGKEYVITHQVLLGYFIKKVVLKFLSFFSQELVFRIFVGKMRWV